MDNTADWVVFRNLAAAAGIVATLQVLAILLCREWVLSDLRRHGCTPLRFHWRPFASTHAACAFAARYVDPTGAVHRARGRVAWLHPKVRWEQDRIVGHLDAPP